MKRRSLYIPVLIMLALVLSASGVIAQSLGPQKVAGPQAVVGTGFTYQGQLKQGGNTFTANCDMAFRLYDSVISGALVGSAVTTTVPVTNSLFTVQLDFGASVFTGDARWLDIQVRCPSGTGGWTQLTPRQVLTPAPYALALPGLYTQQNATSPNLIGGYSGNVISQTLYGATIGGGGANGLENKVRGNYGTIAGGANNIAGGAYSTVGGGSGNQITSAVADHSLIGGGQNNRIDGSAAWNSVIGGGVNNRITGAASSSAIAGGTDNTVSGNSAMVAGGSHNAASGTGAFVGGGGWNGTTIAGNTATSTASVIGGGLANSIPVTGVFATIGGGYGNTASGAGAFVGGGGTYNGSDMLGNTASGAASTIAGGLTNNASGYGAVIGGGGYNLASNWYATVSGGDKNQATGDHATIPGGSNALASHYGEMAYASGGFVNEGDAQSSLYVMRRLATMSVGNWYDLYLDGSNDLLTIASGRTMTFDILIVGRTGSGESAGYRIVGVIENVGGATALIGAPIVTILGEDDTVWTAQVIADDANDALGVQVQGNGENIRWVASVRTVEVQW